MPKRCALGCHPLGVTSHRFPHPERFPETFKAWVDIVGGRLESPSDYAFYRKKTICAIHFTDEDKNRNHRLNGLAVPKLHLPTSTLKSVSPPHQSARQPLTTIRNIDCPIVSPPLSPSLDDTQVSNGMENSTGFSPLSLDIIEPFKFKENSRKVYPSSKETSLTMKKHVTDPPAEHYGSPKSEPVDVESSPTTQMPGSLIIYSPAEDYVIAKTEPEPYEVECSKEIPDPPAEHCEFETSEQTLDDVEPPTTNQYASRLYQEHNYSKQKYRQVREGLMLSLQAKKIFISPALHRKHQMEMQNLHRKIKRLTQKNKLFKSRLQNARTLKNDTAFRRVTKNMTSSAILFTKMQFTETKKNPSGRRFTLEQKMLSLSLYMKGAEAYSLLSKLFTLPSAKTLRRLLTKIKIRSGLIDVVFDKIKDSVPSMTDDEKLCTLIFDELPLTPKIHYDGTKDKLTGFTDFESKVIADHVLVFMIKGVKADYKEPVAYYFTSSVIQIQLKNVITDVIMKLQDAGLKVLCTVCDQAPSNVTAINELVEDNNMELLRMGLNWEYDFFQVNNQHIIPLFDAPNLLTALRNDLLDNDLVYIDYKDQNEQKIVKWDYFLQVHKADKSLGEVRGLIKIMKEHLVPEKIKKNCVKTAAQIFSHKVAVITYHLVARKLVSEECGQLIPIVLLIDKLFDSLNASSLHIPDGKVFQVCVKKASPHHELWKDALKTFKTMKFVVKQKIAANNFEFLEDVTPAINGFIRSIEGMQALWRVLSEKYHFEHMLTRNFNKEPLEDFFGEIRRCGAKNVPPNCLAFEEAYTMLLLSNSSSIEAKSDKASFEWLQKLFLNENLVASDVSEEDDMLTNFTDDLLVLQNEEITYTYGS